MVLKPLVGIFLRMGLPFASFSKIARNVYVEVASEEFGKGGKRANNSRVAMLTGLSRTRVRQELLKLDNAEQDAEIDDTVRPASRLLLGWHTDKRFVDEQGRPGELTGEDFHELYEAYSGKVVPMTAMLKELLTVGAVEMTDSGRLRVLARSFTPQPTDPSALRRVCMAIRDLAQTGSHNLFGPARRRRRFERFATNQLIPVEDAEDFRNFLEAEGQAFLERVDNWMTEREIRDDEGETMRIGVGVYQIAPETKTKKR